MLIRCCLNVEWCRFNGACHHAWTMSTLNGQLLRKVRGISIDDASFFVLGTFSQFGVVNNDMNSVKLHYKIKVIHKREC